MIQKTRYYHVPGWAALPCMILIMLAAAFPAAAQIPPEQQIRAVVEEFLKLEFDGDPGVRLLRKDLVHYTKDKLRELHKEDPLFHGRVHAPNDGKLLIATDYRVGEISVKNIKATTIVTFDTVGSVDISPDYYYILRKNKKDITFKIEIRSVDGIWKITNYTAPAVYSPKGATKLFEFEKEQYESIKETMKKTSPGLEGDLYPHHLKMYNSVLKVMDFLQSIDTPQPPRLRPSNQFS